MPAGSGVATTYSSTSDANGVATKILAHFAEAIDWSDPEQALDTAGAALSELAADSALLVEAVEQLAVGQLEPELGGGGAYWFGLARSEEADLSIWLRFCPTGCVASAHTHTSDILALVVAGTFKQKLIGRGGGVASPDLPTKLFVRHERPGQVFALNTRQEHETSSTAGSLILAATPAKAIDRDEAASVGGELEGKVERAIRLLQRAARNIFPECTA
jgi:hypothetical protein